MITVTQTVKAKDRFTQCINPCQTYMISTHSLVHSTWDKYPSVHSLEGLTALVPNMVASWLKASPVNLTITVIPNHNTPIP